MLPALSLATAVPCKSPRLPVPPCAHCLPRDHCLSRDHPKPRSATFWAQIVANPGLEPGVSYEIGLFCSREIQSERRVGLRAKLLGTYSLTGRRGGLGEL